MVKIISLIFVCLLCVSVNAQSTRKIRQLEKQHAELQKQISESETLLKSTKKDVKSQLDNLALLSGQIDERKKYIETIENDVKTIQLEIDRVQRELEELQAELVDKQNKYKQSVTYMYKNRSIQEKLLFVFSADNLSQMYRRMRYVQQYADYQRLQGMEVKRKQKQVAEKKNVLLASKESKENLLKQGEAEKAKLEAQEQERKALLANLQKKQKGIQNEIRKKRASAEKLNAQIDRLIAIEIEKARKRAEEEARRKAEEARKQAELAAKKGGKSTATAGKTGGKTASPKMETFKVDSEDRRLSGVFEQNRGRLPIPVTGPYVIVGHYGQYQVEGLRNVRLDNKGVDIKGKQGAQARAIFDGEVSAIFQYNGLANVLVRHGSYISVYCNLSSVTVRKGSKVKTRDTLGQIHTDKDGNTILHFQLRKETAKLNPEIWLGR
ncbi:peptidoglycan DD-metalloendopeptidase family protein [uncultured Bacteroides sp.]|uniref:murein hydrolase activator EnvC family protein n=1 Tax=uncultured Bacteroides sp. TaxID=162156 RepID=UPI002608E2F0|nr:peptidoglycan DD-metalloendopeptidase family protein [uncultured Bacteroides sp.]